MDKESIIDFVTSGDVSEISDLSSDDESNDEFQKSECLIKKNFMDRNHEDRSDKNNDDDGDDEDNIPLALVATELAANEDTKTSNSSDNPPCLPLEEKRSTNKKYFIPWKV